jgi:D-alanyl-D-alanine carboxypeptidase
MEALRRSVPLLLAAIVVTGFVAVLRFVEQQPAEPTATSPPSTSDVSPALGDGFLLEQISKVVVREDEGALMVAVVDPSGSVEYAAKGSDPAGAELTPDAVFRIGSVTKVFTAALTLSLVDDGEVRLDSPVTDYVTRVRIPAEVTVRDLLQHTSGIPNFTGSPLTVEARAFDDPHRAWRPEESIGLVAGEDLLFQPGARFSYSNTNYSVLGVLIEEVAAAPLAEVLRDRILRPLGMDDTYLAGLESGRDPFTGYTTFGPTNTPGTTAEPIDFPYTAIATDLWAAGAIVSSVEDLHSFFSGLFGGRVISAESLAAMTGSEEFGLGLAPLSFLKIDDPLFSGGYVALGIDELSEFREVYGHGGAIPGYRTLVLHSPDRATTAVWIATNDAVRFESTIAAVARYIS